MIFHSDDNLVQNAVKVIDDLEKENRKLREQNKRYREGLKKLRLYLEGTIPQIPSNEKPKMLTESLRIINEILENNP